MVNFTTRNRIDLADLATVQATTIPAAVKIIGTQQYSATYPGIGGAAYKRVTSQPSHQLRVRSLDRFLPDGTTSSSNGGWWEIDEQRVTIDMGGAVGDGVVDDAAAVLRVVNWAANREFEVPGRTYYLGTAVTGDYTQRMFRRNGSAFTGPGIGVFHVITNWNSGTVDYTDQIGTPGYGSAVGRFEQYVNLGTTGGYGRRLNYFQTGTQVSGFSIADGRIGVFNSINGGSGMADWAVAVTPENNTTSWGVFVGEWDIINLSGEDAGYARKRGLQSRWCGGLQVVAESANLKTPGQPNTGRNALFAFCVCPSAANNTFDSDQTKFYNGYMVEENSIAPNGVGYLASGQVSATRQPKKAMAVDAYWEEGINLASAVFSTARAITLDYTHNITFGASGLVSSLLANSGGYLSTNVNGEEILRVRRPSGVAANYLAIEGMVAATGFVSMLAEGSDTNISARIVGKGTGGVWLFGQGGTAVAKFTAQVNAVNTFNIFSHVTGFPATIQIVGDTNADMRLQTAGTGVLRFGTFSSNADAAITGYITIKDDGGTSRKLATIA